MRHLLVKFFLFIFLMLGIVSFTKAFGQELEKYVCELPNGGGSSQLLKASRDFATISSSASFPHFPADATLKALVIFVKFSDDNFDLPPLTDGWPSSLNTLPAWAPSVISSTVQPSYSHPSLSGYFHDMSAGQFDLIGDVYPDLYIPDHPQSYYYTSNGRHIGHLVEEILTNLDPNIDYSSYDNLSPGGYSSDGIVDMIFICVRFMDERNLDSNIRYQGIASLTGFKNTFASGTTLTLDSVTIEADFPGSGTIQDAILNTDGIGIICHEYGHYLFGAKHLNGIGSWGLMDGLAGIGAMSAFERIELGWLTSPTPISSNSVNVLLQDALTQNDVKRLDASGTSNDYFLLENRQERNYYDNNWANHDGGMLISHITGSFNIDVECADSKWQWQKNGAFFVYPFVSLHENLINGSDEMELRNVSISISERKSHDDFGGDADDLFNLNAPAMFSPWSNPTSNTKSNTISDKAVILKSVSGTDMYVDMYTDLNNDTFSNSSGATETNSQRKVARSNDGNYHIVFDSEGEVFYRRFNVSTGNWENSRRLSVVGGRNDHPCITEKSGSLYAVWQREVSSGNYSIYSITSTDGGNNWNNAYELATNVTPSSDPLPVIQSGVTNNFSLMVIYRQNNGLYACRTTNTVPSQSTDWTETTVPGTGANDFWPAIASAKNYWGDDANFGVAFANTSGDVHYRYYQHATSGWSSTQFNLSFIVPGSNYTHQMPTLTGIGTGSTQLHVAWHRVYGSGSSQYDHTIIHRKSNGFDSWPNEYFLVYYYGMRRPSLTAVASNKVDLLFQYWNNNTIYKMRFNGSAWDSSPTFVASGQHPSVSTASTNAKYVYTGSNGAPYSVQLSSEILNKAAGGIPARYTRSIAFLDSNKNYLEVQLHGIYLKSHTGQEVPLDIVTPQLDSFEFNPDSAWGLLSSITSFLPSDAESLIVDYSIFAENTERLLKVGTVVPKVRLNLLDRNKRLKGSKLGKSFERNKNISSLRHRLVTALSSYGYIPGVDSIIVNLNVFDTELKSGVFASLGHIYDFTIDTLHTPERSFEITSNSSVDNEQLTLVNYPNPFNPETEIWFQLPSAGKAKLTIFNVLGKKIIELYNGFADRGLKSAKWSAKDVQGNPVASGLYFSVLTAELENGASITISRRLLYLR